MNDDDDEDAQGDEEAQAHHGDDKDADDADEEEEENDDDEETGGDDNLQEDDEEIEEDDDGEMEKNTDNDDHSTEAEEIAGVRNVEEEMDNRYGPRLHSYGLRPRQPRNYSHLMTETDHETVMEDIILKQYSMKKGIKLYGKPGIEAVLSELRQLHDREVMIPVLADALNREMKKRELQYLMFLKKK
jgi:hypothetical protein